MGTHARAAKPGATGKAKGKPGPKPRATGADGDDPRRRDAEILRLPELCDCYEYLRGELAAARRGGDDRDVRAVVRALRRKERELATALSLHGASFDHAAIRFRSEDGESLFRTPLGPRPEPPRFEPYEEAMAQDPFAASGEPSGRWMAKW